jgi:hypothetical protein
VLEHPWGSVVEVLKHEMAHQYVFEVLKVADGPAHGPVFQRVCDRLAIDGRARGLPDAAPSEDDRIVRRIKRLLALAESDNEHEAQAAASAAQRLMLKYNIELLEAGPRGYGFRQIGHAKARTPAHEKQVAGILAAHFFVEAVWVPAFDVRTSTRGWVLELCGTAENLEIAAYVHGFLLETADRLWARHRREANTGNKDRRRYLLGVMMGLRGEAREEHEAAVQEEGLVWVGDRGLDKFVKQRHPHLVTTHGSPIAMDGALASGRAAGREIVLHKPIRAIAEPGQPAEVGVRSQSQGSGRGRIGDGRSDEGRWIGARAQGGGARAGDNRDLDGSRRDGARDDRALHLLHVVL